MILSFVLLVSAVVIFECWNFRRQHRRVWLQERQWDREDREAQVEYENIRMKQALEDLHKPLPPRICDRLLRANHD